MKTNKMIIRLWFVYPFTNLNDIKIEGIGRFITSLCNEFLNREDVILEIWCLKISTEVIKEGFLDLMPSHNLKKIVFETGFYDALVKKINTIEDQHSILLIFRPSTHVLYTGITHRNKVLICYDLVFYPHLFKIFNFDAIKLRNDLVSDINKVSNNLFILGISKFVIENQVLTLTNIKKENTDYVYLPFIPNIKSSFIERIKFSIFRFYNKTPYIICPTQIRPYKNIEVILQALVILKKRNVKVKLLITGNLKDFEPALMMAEGNNLMNDIIVKKDISTEFLNLLYQHSAMCIAPSLAEGQMPWPILESLANKTPVIASNLPQTRERLNFVGVKPENSELFLFEPHDCLTLANSIEYVLKNRDEVLKKQEFLKEKLLTRTWKDVADEYINIFNKVLKRGI